MRKGNVMRGDGISGRELRVLAHVEDHPILAFGILKAFAQKAVAFAVDIRRGKLIARPFAQQAFVHDRTQRTAPALAAVGVHRIERAQRRQRNFTTLGGIRVHIVEMLVIRRILQVAIEGIAMTADHVLFLREKRRRQHQRGQQGQQEGERSESARVAGQAGDAGDGFGHLAGPHVKGRSVRLKHHVG